MTVQVVHGDALQLSAANYATFDALITDPPYSAHVHANATSIGSDGHGVRSRDLGFEHLATELRTSIAAGAGAVRRWSVIFTDYEGGSPWRSAVDGAEWIRRIPWVRWSQPQLSGDRPCTGSEDVLHFSNEDDDPTLCDDVLHFHGMPGRSPIRKRWNGPGSLTHYSRRCMRGQHKHPTEKPIDLMLDLVCYFTDPGESVIDPCGGAGTTALACRLLGRSCLALERDPQWAAYAQGRVVGTLSARDADRAKEWCNSVYAEASSVPAPRVDPRTGITDPSTVKTYERAQRRIADVMRVAGAL